MVNDHYAIVTGASSGLGKALAERLAMQGHNLLLIALPETGLPEQSHDITARHNVSVHYYETDLSVAESPDEIKKYVSEHKLGIDMLINNVGIGYGGGIGEYSNDQIEESIFLNLRCVTLMTNTFIGELKQKKKAFILNIGSFGGFLPMPYKSIYSATKSYIYHFSLGIREELLGTGVHVSVAMPGPIITNHRVRKRVKEMGFIARSNLIEPDAAAAYVLDHMLRGRVVIIPSRTVRLSYVVGSLLPYRLLMLIIGKIFRGVS